MYDTLQFSHQITELPKQVLDQVESPFYWGNIKWTPTFNRKTKEVNGYEASIDNLELKIKGSTVFFKNSLQKWYTGNNYQLFSYYQVVDAIEKLNKQLPFNVYNSKVVYLAVGTVFKEESKPILDTWLSFNGKLPLPMMKKNKIYGKKFYLTDYTLKGYDKTFEAYNHERMKIPDNIFRLELEIYTRNLRSRKNPIIINTVKDLIDKKKYRKLSTELLSKYIKIEKKQSISLSKLNNKQKEILALFYNKKILQQYKKDHFESYRKKRTVYKNINKMTNNTYLEHLKIVVKTSIMNSLF